MDALKITDFTIDGLDEELFEMFRFQGYDPNVTFEQLKKNATKNGLTANQMKEGVQDVLVFYCVRGAKSNTRSAQKTDPDGLKRIKDTMRKLGIEDKKPTSSTDVNIARVIGVFAMQTANIIAKYPNRVRATTVVREGPEKFGLPSFACFPQVASIIPDEATLSKFKQFAVAFDRVINRNQTQPSSPNFATREDEVMNYVQITYDSQFIPKEQRGKMWAQLKSISR